MVIWKMFRFSLAHPWKRLVSVAMELFLNILPDRGVKGFGIDFGLGKVSQGFATIWVGLIQWVGI